MLGEEEGREEGWEEGREDQDMAVLRAALGKKGERRNGGNGSR